MSRAPISALPSSANARSASRTAAVSSPSCDSRVRAASRYVLPTIRSWVSTTASATNVSLTRRRRPRESPGGGCPGSSRSRRRSSAPLPAQPRDPMQKDPEPRCAGDARGGSATGWRRPNCSPGGTRSAIRASMRRSASTSASAQSRSIVVVAGRMVRVRRQASTNLRTRSSFDCGCGASGRAGDDQAAGLPATTYHGVPLSNGGDASSYARSCVAV